MKRIFAEYEPWIVGIAGTAMLMFFGWSLHVPLAMWLAPLLLLRAVRVSPHWSVMVALFAASISFRWANITGGWDMPLVAEIGFSALVVLPLWAGLLADRLYNATRPEGRGRLGRLLAFPAVYTLGHYFLGFSPVGTVFSPAAGQFALPALSQTVSLAGLAGLTFLIGLTATTVNEAWEGHFQPGRVRRPVAALLVVFAALLVYGHAKLLLTEPISDTVKVAGISEPHPRDYWAITDAGTPRESRNRYGEEMSRIRDALFDQSSRAVTSGAEIIVWAEGNAVMYEDEEDTFVARARSFAREHDVHLAAAAVVLRYGETKNDNIVYLFGPDGTQHVRYEKTISWYPTDSDGIIPAVETEWGTLSAVICFDLDFPRLLRQAARKGTDILLVPGYDTRHISPYHTQIGSLRGLEYGFSVFRQGLKSTSMAFDYNGNVLARQDYFTTSERLMIADVPTEGIGTIYGQLGDWFVVVVALVVAVLSVMTAGRWRASRRDAPGAGFSRRS